MASSLLLLCRIIAVLLAAVDVVSKPNNFCMTKLLLLLLLLGDLVVVNVENCYGTTDTTTDVGTALAVVGNVFIIIEMNIFTHPIVTGRNLV